MHDLMVLLYIKDILLGSSIIDTDGISKQISRSLIIDIIKRIYSITVAKMFKERSNNYPTFLEIKRLVVRKI
jgi:hypothetical protein